MYKKIRFLFNISWRITLVYALLFSLVLCVLSAGLLYGIRVYFLYQAEQQVIAVERGVENLVLTSPENRRLTDLNDRLLENVPTADNITVFILNAKRQIMVPQKPGNQQKAIQRLLKDHPEEQHTNASIEYKEIHDHHLIYIDKMLYTQNHELIHIQVVKDLHNIYEFLTILLIMLAIFDFLGVLVSLIIGHMVSRRTLQPVDTIISTAENISAYDLSQRIQVSGPDDELSRLARTLNNMIARLESAFNRQRQFVSDASHELRTPVAVLKGYANMIDRWGKADQAVLDEGIAAINKEAENMEKLIEKLLFLARGDSNELRLEPEEFNLGRLLEEVVHETRLLTDRHRIQLVYQESFMVKADRGLIKEALRAVVDNSIKFTPADGLIQIGLEKAEKYAVIKVKDSGYGIPEEEQPYIMGRFYQVDKSRNRKPGSSGLGLSIVKLIIERHGGSLLISSEVDQGTLVTFTLPLENLIHDGKEPNKKDK